MFSKKMYYCFINIYEIFAEAWTGVLGKMIRQIDPLGSNPGRKSH